MGSVCFKVFFWQLLAIKMRFCNLRLNTRPQDVGLDDCTCPAYRNPKEMMSDAGYFPLYHRTLQGGKEDRFLFIIVIQQELRVSQLNFLIARISLQDIMSSKDLSSAYPDDRIGSMSLDSVLASTQLDSGVTVTKVTSHIRAHPPLVGYTVNTVW